MATPFVEERFNTGFRYGLVGGPEFSTTIVETDSGVEHVNINWSEGLGRWTTGPDLYIREEIEWLVKFFTNRKGQAIGFRFKAWEDFEVSIAEGVSAHTTGNVIQLYKRYASDTAFTDKVIKKPNEIDFKLFKDGVEQIGGWALDTTTGLVTLAAYDAVAAYSWSGTFDKPARFTTDKFECEFMVFRESDGERMFQVTGLGVKEIRLP